MSKTQFTSFCNIFAVALIMLATVVQAQSKKEIEKSLKETTNSKDSIQKLYNSLSAKHDSLTMVCISYDNMYKIIKEKVVHYKYKPADIGKIIDSLHLNRDSATMKNRVKYAAIMDTVKRLKHIADSLRYEDDHLGYMVNKYAGKGTIPAERKDLSGIWEVSARWLKIADDSVQGGINLMSDSPDSNSVIKLIFLDLETVKVLYRKGDSLKCFYQVNAFSKDKPYTIDFTHGSKVNVRLNVNPFEGELYVSYRKGKGYYYGYMRRK